MVREFDWRYFFDQIEFDRDAIGGGIGLIGEIMFGENAGLSQQPATHRRDRIDEREREEFYYSTGSILIASQADSTPRSRARPPSHVPPASDRPKL